MEAFGSQPINAHIPQSRLASETLHRSRCSGFGLKLPLRTFHCDRIDTDGNRIRRRYAYEICFSPSKTDPLEWPLRYCATTQVSSRKPVTLTSPPMHNRFTAGQSRLRCRLLCRMPAPLLKATAAARFLRSAPGMIAGFSPCVSQSDVGKQVR
jgi:hypothetical protein